MEANPCATLRVTFRKALATVASTRRFCMNLLNENCLRIFIRIIVERGTPGTGVMGMGPSLSSSLLGFNILTFTFTSHWKHAIGCGLCCCCKVNFVALPHTVMKGWRRVALETVAGLCADP